MRSAPRIAPVAPRLPNNAVGSYDWELQLAALCCAIGPKAETLKALDLVLHFKEWLFIFFVSIVI